MKKLIACILTAALLLSLAAGCASGPTGMDRDQQEAEGSGLTLHKIGVATYNLKDAQIMMFKEYLDNYIKSCFSDVTFLYSAGISSSEGLMDFLALCAENDVEGVMLFGSYDLQKEVEFCAENGMYLIRPAATSSDADFEAVASNPYYLGEIGPGVEREYETGAEMARAMAGADKTYVIFSSRAAEGNEMHRLRTVGILDALQEVYGVTFDRSSEELAAATEPTEVEAGELQLVICPGYLEEEDRRTAALEIVSSGRYNTVLSVVPAAPVMDAISEVEMDCGVIDCFSEDNDLAFKRGTIDYVAGKYQSQIGPAFAAMYNAITGYAEDFREDGRAFRLEQDFWVASNAKEFDTMFALARGAVVNAYNYEDLCAVIKSLTPEANFEAFRNLTESSSYEDCLARRSA